MSGGYIVPSASHRAVAGSAWLGRERLMEQPVSSGRSSSCETETQATCRSHEHALCQINADRRNLHDGCPPRFKWSMTLPLWHIDAVAGGGVHPIAFQSATGSNGSIRYVECCSNTYGTRPCAAMAALGACISGLVKNCCRSWPRVAPELTWKSARTAQHGADR